VLHYGVETAMHDRFLGVVCVDAQGADGAGLLDARS
jgi:hypothetical protein